MKTKKRIVLIKEVKEVLIKINDNWFYKYHRCGCSCNKRISYNSCHYRFGIPKFINFHHSKSKYHPMLGKYHSEETINKMRKSRSGENNSMFGKHHSQKTKEKIGRANSGKNSFWFGKKCPEQSKRMLGNNYNPGFWKRGKNNHNYGRLPSKSAGRGKRCYYDSPLQGKVCFRSTYELKYAKYLDKKSILWKYEHKTYHLSNGTSYTPDFYLLKSKKYREIKGYMSDSAQDKINLFRKEYPNKNFKVLYYKDLVRKGIL